MRKKLALYGMAAGLVLATLSGCSGIASAGQENSAEVTTEAETTAETETATEAETAVATDDLKENEEGPGVPVQMEPLLVWGQVTAVSAENDKITINNQSGNSSAGEMVLNISENTRTVDAVEALPVDWTGIAEGDFIYTYIGPAMTMSLPPMTNAELIICRIPADFRVPSLVKVSAMEVQEDGSYLLSAVGGAEYTVPKDCPIQPYLTKMMVYLEQVGEGDTCLIWMGSDNQVYKMVLFAK